MRFLKPIDGDVLFTLADGRCVDGKLLTTVQKNVADWMWPGAMDCGFLLYAAVSNIY